MTIAESQTTEIIKTETSAIASLEGEITQRNLDIELLREAIATLEAGKTRPINPEADSAFALLLELVGSAPQRLEDKQSYQAKLEAARLSLKLATEICEQKLNELKGLKQEHSLEQSDHLLGELLSKAEKFNAAIDSSFDLLAEMKSLSSKIMQLRGDRIQVLEVTADLIETAYCQISGNRVKVRRRFDIKRE